jgi:oligoribonuclease NrnB/cAMP/cGMP phosphodiesterase (DHH superfamily)
LASSRDIYILDFSYARQVLLSIKAVAKTLLVLDHHKTAEKELEGLDFCKFDMNKSGCRLTWEHFNPGQRSFCPPLIRYVEDRDLWRFHLPDSKQINAAIQSYPFSFETWEDLNERMDAAVGQSGLVKEGAAILRYQEKKIVEALEGAFWDISHGTPADYLRMGDVANVSDVSIISEIGQRLAAKNPSGIGMTFREANGQRIYSLRSLAPDGPDVSEIARAQGGGGHKHAAGFTVQLP